MSKETTETAVLWQRVSTKKQSNPTKYALTRKKAEAYCNGEFPNKTGSKYELSKEKFRLAGSAFKKSVSDSDEMQRLLAMHENGELPKRCHLIFANADRLSREDEIDSTHELTGLVKRGFVLHCLYSGLVLDKDDVHKQMALQMFIQMLSRAHEESKAKQSRALDQLKAMLSQIRESEKNGKTNPLVNVGKGDKLYCKIPPKWFLEYCPNKGWVIDEIEANKIRYVFDRLSEGQTANALAKELNELAVNDKAYRLAIFSKGKPRKIVGYKKWTSLVIKRIYDNRAVIGGLQTTYTNLEDEEITETFDNYYEPIIELATWQKVKRLIKSRTRVSGKEAFKPSIFTTLCKCGYCRDDDGTYTSCRRQRIKYKDGSSSIGIQCTHNQKKLNECTWAYSDEANITKVLVRYLKEVDINKLLKPESGARANKIKAELADKIKLQDQLDEDRKKLLDAIKGKTIEIIQIEAQRLQTEIDKTKTQIKTFKDELADLTAQSMSSFNKSNIEKLDKFLQQDINVKRLNAELTEVTRSIELYPKGLPYTDCLNAVGKGYGKKENKGDIYGTNFPSLRLNFKNGVTRTLVFYKHDINKVLIINHDSDKIEVSLDWGKTTLDKMTALGSSKSELNALDRGIFAVIQSWTGITQEKWQKEYIERFFKPAHQKKLKKMIADGAEILI